jgi:hypothetical protein
MQSPLADHWNTSNELQYATFVREPSRSCVYCCYVDVKPSKRRSTGRSLGCLHPKALYGQAGEGKGCCSFLRETGSDDDL